MIKLYNKQTDLKIVVQTGKDLTGASEIKLKYRDPNGLRGEYEITSSDLPLGTIEYQTPINEPLEVAGDWRFWAYIVEGGRVSIGQSFVITISEEGQ